MRIERILLLVIAYVAVAPARDRAVAMPGIGAAVDPEYVAHTWTTEDGLPHDTTSVVAQDRTGFLWIGTMNGLARFDSREFTTYRVPWRARTGGRNVRSLVPLPDGSILFVSAGGGLFVCRNKEIVEYPLSVELSADDASELHIEPNGAIWLGIRDGVLRYDHGHIERFGPDVGVSRRAGNFTFATDSEGRTWVAGERLLACYDHGHFLQIETRSSGSFRVASAHSGGVWVFGGGLYRSNGEGLTLVATEPWPPGRASAHCLFEDTNGRVWVGTSHEGAFCYSARGFRHVSGVDGSIADITEDTEGDIWLATDHGICRLRRRLFECINRGVTSIAEDRDGALWLAAGVDGIVRKKADQQLTFPLRRPRDTIQANTIAVDSGGQVWVGSRTGAYVFNPVSGATRKVKATLGHVRMFVLATNGDMWVAGNSAFGYFRENQFVSLKQALPPNDHITAFIEDRPGHYLIGTSLGNVFEFAAGKLVRSRLSAATSGGVIQAIVAEASGALWFATTEGLVFADRSRVCRLARDNGLPDDVVLQLLQDQSDNLWLTVPAGLYRIDRTELTQVIEGKRPRFNALAYGPEEGVTGASPFTNYQPAALKDHNGVLWFCTYRGTFGIDPKKIPANRPAAPFFLDEIRINGRTVNRNVGLSIPKGEAYIEFRFANLSFRAPERVRLRHQLVGFDPDWVDTPADRRARYSNLPPGHYELRAGASNTEGIWNSPNVAVQFEVLPSWWQTTLFRLVLFATIAASSAMAARYWSQRKLRARLERLERQHALNEERARIARDMHDDIGGSLTALGLAVQRAREEVPPQGSAAIEMIERGVARLTLELDRVVWTVSPENTSLDRLASFIERFAQQFFADSAIECRVYATTAIPEVPLSPDCQHHILAITKESLNNALKHSGAKYVNVSLAYLNGMLTLTIQDDGAGFSPQAKEHSRRNGLRNIRTRASALRGIVEIRSEPGVGTEILLKVTVKPAPQSRI